MSFKNNRQYGGDRQEGDEQQELGIRVSRENDQIDEKYGFHRVKDQQERTGYLINMHSTEVLDEDRRMVAALDLFFIKMDGARFKVTVVFQPYFLVLPRENHSLEVARFLGKKYAGQLSRIEHIQKEDLDLPNHLSGIKQNYIQMWFPNTNALMKVRREILAIVRKNQEREKTNTFYMKMLSASLAAASHSTEDAQTSDYLESIIDIREYDVPYHVRVSIDLKIFCGQWYNVRCLGGDDPPLITNRSDLLERPDPVVFAFDIETTKLPLKFPDAQTDQIMMISYMVDGQGYLITNREIISHDVDDFEYTPKPEYEGNFAVANEPSERALLQRFFDHIVDLKPHIFVTYNGDFFDWPFIETRAAIHDMDMKQEIGFAKNREGVYICRPAMHMDCLCWVKRDSYLPVGSQGLKAVTKSKLRYNPIELEPEEMCRMAVEQPQVLSNYSVSDAVATYYLYMKYVHPFIFALATIIPLEPDEILRKGSGTLCEALLMVEAFDAHIIFPNKQQQDLNKLSTDGHVLDSETYVGGHVEALESGVFRADIPCRFRLDPILLSQLKENIHRVLTHAIEVEEGVPMTMVTDLDEVTEAIECALQKLQETPTRTECPAIYHLDVGAMYPNIILTNRLQPSAIVTETECAACEFNRPDARCKRDMTWSWRGEMLPASRSEFQRIQQQLETEKFPSLFPGGPTRAFHELSKLDQAAYEKKRLTDYCRKAYKKVKVTKVEERTSTVCQKENSFYVDTVRAFRDRRYEYKGLTKSAKAAVVAAVASGDAAEVKTAKGREILYDSLQLAHKCILNSFYGYVMRRGARWHSMPMAGIVCLTGAHIIKKAREIIERVGRPLELDTDGIWCILPSSFPQEFVVHTTHAKKKKITVSYPNAVLNMMVKDSFTNDQYFELRTPAQDGQLPEYERRNENSIFFEVDGPYKAMILPAAKEEGKKLKKRYAVFNFDGSIAELKGFEIKRRGELQLIKIFQSSVFDAFLGGDTLETCYESVATVANFWLDVLFTKGSQMPDNELFDLISENRSMSRKLEDYGSQKSTSISTAKRLAEFLGDQMVKDAGLACKYIISRKPEGAPVTERAIPLAIFQSEASVRRHYLRRWLKDNAMGDADIRDILDWNYYIERLGGAIQKIITIPAALQGVANPVPRIAHPEWLHKKIVEKTDVLKQRRINEMFAIKERPSISDQSETVSEEICDIEDMAGTSNACRIPGGVALVTTTKRKRTLSADTNKTWREACGTPPDIGTTREDILNWVRYQKRKWAWQRNQRDIILNRNQEKRSRVTENEDAPIVNSTVNRAPISTIGGFLRRTQRTLLEMPWQIIQIVAQDDEGHFIVWAMVGDELHKVRVNVPRIFYVNQRTAAPPEQDDMWKKVHRVLPRSRPIHYLYQYTVSEAVFKENRLGMLADLATPDIEGVYETQMSLEFRALMDLGCICMVQRSEARRLIAQPSKETSASFSLRQLESKSLSYSPYLAESVNLKRIFLYHHSIPSGKREMWGLFLTPTKRAVIVVFDTVRTNQMPNMRSLFAAERQIVMTKLMETQSSQQLPPDDITFEVHVETNLVNVYRHLQRSLTAYREEKRGPTLLCVQIAMSQKQLVKVLPVAADFPRSQIFIGDDASLLSGMEWQRNGARSMVRYFLNLHTIIETMLEQSRYFHLPVGNLPPDPVLFGADLFFARLLQRHNFVLWWSPTSRPDLGGREADDSRLLVEFEECVSVIQNRPGYYPCVCVELAIDSLAVSSLLQAAKIQDGEGASAAVTFDVIQQASMQDMMGKALSATLPSYDETVLCSAAFRIMRSMVNGWLREVLLNRNVFSDFQIVHFYRWVRSSNALLYDPALRRALNNLMRKMFLQIIAEFQRLGADIIYADFNRVVINTGKKSVGDGISYADYLVKSVRNKEIFHSINLSYQQSWEFLHWMDTANYSGVKGKLPKEMNDTDMMDEEDDDEISLEMNWNIAEHLPQTNNCRQLFEDIITQYMTSLIEKENPAEAVKKLAHTAYGNAQKLHKNYPQGKPSPAVEFIKALVKVLSVEKSSEEEINTIRRNMLQLVGVGEFSDLACWVDPGKSYVLGEVICKACNHCRDLDLCKDRYKALKNGTPVWLCDQCSTYYENEEIESRLLDVVNRKMMSYTLQDLKCVRCKQIKRENIAENCSCAGGFETLIATDKFKELACSFLEIAKTHKMDILQENVEFIIGRC